MSSNTAAPLLVLLGFMGAGKSTIGKLLAAELGCPFLDLDHSLEAMHGPIPELFASRGESGFRAIEHHHLDLILPTLVRPSVLALGGGTFVQPANRELLALHGATSIFLDVPFEILHSRVAHSGAQRPLVRDREKLRDLYEERRPSYLLATHTCVAGEADPTRLLTRLVQLAIRLGAPPPPRDTL